jgi:hypothetical protein
VTGNASAVHLAGRRLRAVLVLAGLTAAAIWLAACGAPVYEERASQDIESSDPGQVAAAETRQFAQTVGPRATGTWADIAAREYVTLALQQFGYVTRHQEFLLEEGGASSANIIVVKEGAEAETLVVGAHYDSAPASPGAADNASGIGLLLELAGRLREAETRQTLVFVAFGAQQQNAAGARYYLERLAKADRRALIGMIDLDAVAGGERLVAYGPEGEGSWLRDGLGSVADEQGIELDVAVADGGGAHAPFAAAELPYAGLVTVDGDGPVDVARPTDIAGTARDTVERLVSEARLAAQLRVEVLLLTEFLSADFEATPSTGAAE